MVKYLLFFGFSLFIDAILAIPINIFKKFKKNFWSFLPPQSIPLRGALAQLRGKISKIAMVI